MSDKPAFAIRLDVHLHSAPDRAILDAIHDLKETIMANRDEFLAQINDLRTQLDASNATLVKSQGEVVAAVSGLTTTVAANNQKIAELEAALAAAGGDIPPDVLSAFAAAKASADAVDVSAKALDALNPDAP